jgi:hypothetical protein
MDVTTAYLNAPIDYPVFIEQPKGYEVQGKDGKKLYCKLNKSLYGLKQSGRLWNRLLTDFLIAEGFTQSNVEPCLFSMYTDSHVVKVIVFVDDILIACNSCSILNDVKARLNHRFKMKDLGEVNWFLGMEIERKDDCISINQTAYLKKLLEKHGMDNCKPVPTPCCEKQIFEAEDDEPADVSLDTYRSIVGSLVYAVTCTRPDLCYVVSKLAQYLNVPVTKRQWLIVKRVFRYVKGTLSQSLCFRKCETAEIIGYCDSDWAGSEDRRSTSGYCFALGKHTGAISWKSQRQSCVALSSCEAEYVAVSSAFQEGSYLKQLLVDIDCNVKADVIVFSDSQSAIALAKNPVHHRRSKHIDIRYHFVRSLVENGFVLSYVPSEEMLADMFTKPVGKVILARLIKGIFGL